MIPSPKNIDGELLKHFNEVPNSANISPPAGSTTLEPPNRNDINEMYRRIWITNTDLLKAYDYGANIGSVKFSSNITLNNILYSLVNALKQVVSNEVLKSNGNLEEYKPIYDALNSLFIILQNKISSQTNKNVDSMAILAALHGFMCSYVNSVKNIT